MTMPKTPTRKQLSRYFHDTDTLIRFEQLFETVGKSHGDILAILQTAGDSTFAQVNSALAQIYQLQNRAIELEFLMVAQCIS